MIIFETYKAFSFFSQTLDAKSELNKILGCLFDQTLNNMSA